MIYASFTDVVFVKELIDFRAIMDISPCPISRLSPAEARMVRRFILSKNVGRCEVFVNMNKSVAVVLRADPDVVELRRQKHLLTTYSKMYPGWREGLWDDAFETSDGLWACRLPQDFYGSDVDYVELTETREGLFVCTLNDYHFFTA